jgi:hypothetical protein
MTWHRSNPVSGGPGTTKMIVQHGSIPFGQTRDGYRTIIVLVLKPGQTVTSINIRNPDGTENGDSGFAAYGTHEAHGRKFLLFGKICGPTEPLRHIVTFTPAVPSGVTIFGVIADFITDGAPIRTTAFVDTGTVGNTLTLPSVTAAAADDIYTMVWNDPTGGSAGQLYPVAPLIGDAVMAQTDVNFIADAHESHQSSAPTGTRSYSCPSPGTTYDAAIGVIMLVGQSGPLGGWGVGQVRMGTN